MDPHKNSVTAIKFANQNTFNIYSRGGVNTAAHPSPAVSKLGYGIWANTQQSVFPKILSSRLISSLIRSGSVTY